MWEEGAVMGCGRKVRTEGAVMGADGRCGSEVRTEACGLSPAP